MPAPYLRLATCAVIVSLALACSPDQRGEGKGPPPTLITATEYAFGVPDTIPSGLVALRLANAGREPHQAGVVRIEGKRTTTEIAAALESSIPPPWMSFVGGPDAVDPGDTASATQVLTPGTYVLVCYLRSPDGTMHLEKGMIRTFVVREPAPTPPVTVAGDDTITLADFTFNLAHPLSAGTRTIYVANNGPQLHEVMILALAPGKGVHDLLAWTSQVMPGPLPGRPLGGIVALDAGKSATFTVTLTQGKYLLVCFIPDAKDGTSHLLRGMVEEFTVE